MFNQGHPFTSVCAVAIALMHSLTDQGLLCLYRPLLHCLRRLDVCIGSKVLSLHCFTKNVCIGAKVHPLHCLRRLDVCIRFKVPSLHCLRKLDICTGSKIPSLHCLRRLDVCTGSKVPSLHCLRCGCLYRL